jgi:hypothetical protein
MKVEVAPASLRAAYLFLKTGRQGKISMKYTWYSKANAIFGAKGHGEV